MITFHDNVICNLGCEVNRYLKVRRVHPEVSLDLQRIPRVLLKVPLLRRGAFYSLVLWLVSQRDFVLCVRRRLGGYWSFGARTSLRAWDWPRGSTSI
jgi:hypothetical protein